MKKLLIGLFIFGFFAIGAQVYAVDGYSQSYTNIGDNSNAESNTMSDSGCSAGAKYSYTTGQACSPIFDFSPSITVLSPNNGGEFYTDGQQITIRWTSNNISADTPVNLVLTGYDSAGNLVMNTLMSQSIILNDGSEILNLPKIPTYAGINFGKYFKIEVNNNGKGVTDSSDNYFTINSSTVVDMGCQTGAVYSSTTGQACPTNGTPSITVLSPNGGEVYQTGQQITVKWKTENILTPSTTTVEMINNDTNESVLLGDAITLNGSVVLRLPLNTNTWKNNKIKLTAINSKEGGVFARDLSDNFFTITTDNGCSNGAIFSSITGAKCLDNSTPSITVLSPNGGESYVLGQDFIPRWKVSGMSTSDEITVELEDTITKNQIVIGKKFGTDTAVGTKLPADSIWGLGNRYKIRITAENSSGNTIAQDYSDNSFTINSSTTPSIDYGCSNGAIFSSITGQTCTSPFVTLLTPNGGEQIYKGNLIRIKWNSLNISKIYLKLYKGGDIYHDSSVSPESTISLSPILASTGYFDWLVPNSIPNGTDYSIQIANADSGTLADFSDASFAITSSSTDIGCSNGAIYSNTTGQRCLVVIDNGCNGTRYSTTTGQLCGTTGTTITNSTKRTLRWGLIGDDVKALQEFLGISADGVYGRGTASKVKEWQASQGLYADGVFGNTSRQTAGLE